ncbi:MAG: ABC transporter ATP-binding protein [bacterium]|nr:ABC transporter ATP-binding protein [bacterium]
MSKVIVARDVVKYYRSGERELHILQGVNLGIAPGETVAVVGESGIGKTTLLNILGGLDKPTSGSVHLNDVNIFSLNDTKRTRLRNTEVGFVFQFHHLLAEFTALENVMIPLLLGRFSPVTAKKKAKSMLETVGLGERLTHRPNKLSGGERQRVALARALVTEPSVVLADEPTGNLDAITADKQHDLIFRLSEDMQQTFVIVTHNTDFASRCDRVLTLSDGVVEQV